MMKKKREFKKQKPHTPKTGKDHHEDMIVNLKSWIRRERELLAHDLEQQGDPKGAELVLGTAVAFGEAFDELTSLLERLKDKPKIAEAASA